MKTHPDWQLQFPIDAVVFDCDGTLSMLEGIDELAKNNGVTEAVAKLTQEAMAQSGLNPNLYKKRLDLVKPKYSQVEALGQDYFKHQVPDAKAVIEIFHRLNKSVYMVSAGLYPAVKAFGKQLAIPQENIFAVDIHFDANGQFCDYETTSPLIHNDGKRKIVNELKNKHATVVHIGDGLNDYCTYDLVTRFIGYGGVYYRENIASKCQYYIETLSLAPLLPLLLTSQEYELLNEKERGIYLRGIEAIETGHVNV